MSQIVNVPLKLSETKPDFEALVLQLQLFLSQKNTWIDRLTSSTGQTLLEMMAAVGTFNQFGIESAARESFLVTAARDSSIYAITTMLGVRITRKTPASVVAQLTRSGSTVVTMSLPRFSTFVVNGVTYFNRDSVVFPAGESIVSAPLYEGTVKQQTFAANSQAFREIYLKEPGFVVSDVDLEVYLVNPNLNEATLWTPIEDGIWVAPPEATVYYDRTSGLGDTILAFGDGYHGALPPVGFNIVVKYAITSGASIVSGSAGLEILFPEDPTIRGITTSSIAPGADEKPASYYKLVASNLYKARSRAVTNPDYKAITLSYPGVASVVIQAQRDVNPGDIRWMNVVRICILPANEDAFTSIEWDTFLEWFATKSHAAIDLQIYNPIKLVEDINLIVAMTQTAVAVEVTSKVTDAITQLFAKNINTLGNRIAKSDIDKVCTAIVGVDYVDIVSPLTDLVCPTPLHYFALGNLNVSTIYSERIFFNG